MTAISTPTFPNSGLWWLIPMMSGNCSPPEPHLTSQLWDRLDRNGGGSVDRGSERCTDRVRRKRSVCSLLPCVCVCVQYKRPSGLHLCQLSLSACVPILLAVPAPPHPPSITLFMHVSVSPSCLRASPYVSYSLSITFSGSPGQPVKRCNLSPSPGP